MTNPLDAALFYASKGWLSFPLLPHDKHPLFKAAHEPGNPCHGECGKIGHGFHDATVDTTLIRDWWTQYPEAGVGIATGKRSGFFALDVDAAHGGEGTLAHLIEQHSKLPDTVVQQTGGGGRHILFSYPPVDVGNSAGKLGTGLDTRGTGGYICAAPTIHPSGRPYRWINAPSKTELSGAPDWLLHSLLEGKSTPAPAINTPDGVFPSGQRNSSLTSIAGAMQRKGMSEEAIFVALNVENLNRCVPPLTENEVRQIAASVTRYQATAAMPLTSKDRLRAEWSFVKCLFEYPEDLIDYTEMTPRLFSDVRLADFFDRLRGGASSVSAAADAGLLDELEKYNDYMVPRMPDYAKAITDFAHYEQVAALGSQLQKAAHAADTERIGQVALDINKTITSVGRNEIISLSDVADKVDAQIDARVADPVEVWGIPYAWSYLSTLTGGKQAGEMILLAGEPKVGKSWWALQDALHTAIYNQIPTVYWSGEMRREQLVRRLYQLLGVNGRNMRTGQMTEQDFEKQREAKALLLNSPLYLNDGALSLSSIRPMLQQQKNKYGIKQFVIDYAFLVDAPGRDEIERTGNVSREIKMVCAELDLSGILITSVNKAGMDTGSESVSKSNVRGSGQQIHDADIIYLITKFAPVSGDTVALKYMPAQHDRLITLHATAGREFDQSLPGGRLHFSRKDNSPALTEELQEPLGNRLPKTRKIETPIQAEWTDK